MRGEQKKNSDIDLLIDYDHRIGISLFEIVRLTNYLTTQLGIKVDLALKRKLKTAIGNYILKEVIYI